MHIVAIEPYYGGSHKAFLDGLARHSRHDFAILSLPARKWKWRMRGAALTFAEMLDRHDGPMDLLFCSDYLSLADLVGLRPRRLASVPKAVYFHENQLTYPVQDESERDYHFAFTNITACLAADAVFFNSDFHRSSFIEAVGGFLHKMPDHRPEAAAREIEGKARTLPLGVDFGVFDECQATPRSGDDPAFLLWNHRWEYDKNPEDFFAVLFDLAESGLRFDLAVVGERFRTYPAVFDTARERLRDHIIQFGFLPSKADYARLLHEADIVVSTAIHEFFGISVVEAIYCGCFPLLPHRLSYPELLPPERHERHLYHSLTDLRRGLDHAVRHIDSTRATKVSETAARFRWEEMCGRYDEAFDKLAGGRT
ncbi:MAG: DUF3524 domain-containing protein [Planctomycetes bacterium]|nr:DUF3524 domain-containing protein [Planctomycetota bacterium]